MEVPTTVHGTRLNQAVLSMNLWIAVGTCGSIGLALTGTTLGAVIRPGNPRWWFAIPEGGALLSLDPGIAGRIGIDVTRVAPGRERIGRRVVRVGGDRLAA